jgi:integrase
VWTAGFINEDGVRVNRSTKQSNRKKAQALADEWETIAKKARHGELTQEIGLKTINRILEASGARRIEVPSIHEAFERWYTDREGRDRSEATLKRYRGILNNFYAYLGAKKVNAPISSLTTTELENWHLSERSSGKSGTTADLGINIIRGALSKMIHKFKFIDANPATGVEPSEEGGESREVFTDDEVRRLLAVCDIEWKGMILCSAWHSIRLHDAASLTWKNVNLESGSISYIPSKTRRKNPEPTRRYMPVETLEYLKGLALKSSSGPLFPRLYGRTSGSHGGLSNEFNRLMVKAGITIPLGQKKEGRGRQFRKKGFHSFRHFSITRMAETDIPDAQRRLLAGHSSDSKTHTRYIHANEAAQKKALAKLKPLT